MARRDEPLPRASTLRHAPLTAAIGCDPPNHSGKTLLKKSIGRKTPIKTKIQELVLRLLYAQNVPSARRVGGWFAGLSINPAIPRAFRPRAAIRIVLMGPRYGGPGPPYDIIGSGQ